MRVGFVTGGTWLADDYKSVRLDTGAVRMLTTGNEQIARAAVRERAIREALGRWVSELEPALVYDSNRHFIGLCVAGSTQHGQEIVVTVSIRGGVPI